MLSRLAAERNQHDASQPGKAVAHSHPDRLASIAMLFGLTPRAVDACRVLELGCGAGLNLLPMADRHPESTFVGLDRSPTALAMARQLASSAGLTNAEFHALQLDGDNDGLGAFDYIICDGLFSRMPPELQDALLAFCRARLNPQGILYLSYRAQPGWIVPGVVRSLARAASKDQDPVPTRVAKARQAVQFLVDTLPQNAQGWSRLLRGEAILAHGMPDVSLVHEYLGAHSHPVYFHELAASAGEHRLQYLGDADIRTMFAATLGTTVENKLAQVARDTISLEQYMDLLCNRSGHRSLFCRQDMRRAYQWTPERLQTIRLAGQLQPVAGSIGLENDEPARFATADGRVLGTALPAAKVALELLAEAWPRSIAFEALLETVSERMKSAAHAEPFDQTQRDELGRTIIECVVNGFLEIHSDVDRFTVAVSDRPQVGRWTLAEAEATGQVTNRRHEPVSLDEMSHQLLKYLDGQRDRAALVALLVEAVNRGQLSILREGLPAGTGSGTMEILEQVLDQALDKLARHALLVA
jgi:methyltransferase-like protein/2-polyprenyl-3-methyl-5-hydroxy-6-metoxy-1,4-benzoquinol methylase